MHSDDYRVLPCFRSLPPQLFSQGINHGLGLNIQIPPLSSNVGQNGKRFHHLFWNGLRCLEGKVLRIRFNLSIVERGQFIFGGSKGEKEGIEIVEVVVPTLVINTRVLSASRIAQERRRGDKRAVLHMIENSPVGFPINKLRPSDNWSVSWFISW